MPTLILQGGPLDGRFVDSTSDDATTPTHLGFDAEGIPVFVFVDNRVQFPMFDQWTIREIAGWGGSDSTYRRTGQVDREGRIVFEVIESAPEEPKG